MVRAILEGRKTKTRRVVKKPSSEWLTPDMFTPAFVANPDNNLCPYGNPGDTLWVRETFQYVDFAGEDNGYVYRAKDLLIPTHWKFISIQRILSIWNGMVAVAANEKLYEQCSPG